MRPGVLNFFFKPLSSLKGIGPVTKQKFTKIFGRDEPVAKDLLMHVPVNIITREVEPNLLLISDGSNIIITLKVESVQEKRAGARKFIYNIECSSKSGFVTIVYFNAHKDTINKMYAPGRVIKVAGKIERYNNRIQIAHPDYVVNGDKEIDAVEPVYPLTAGISNRLMNKTVKMLLPEIPKLDEWCDKEFLAQGKFSTFDESLKKIHNPKTMADLDISAPQRKRLAFDEMLANQLALALSRRSLTKQKGVKIETENIFTKELLNVLPYKLTGGQKDITKEIFADLRSDNKMFRLIQGDVGSGKTIVAILAMLKAVEAGFQAAFMLPTEILAKQQYDIMKEILENDFFKRNNIKTCLLVGSVKEAEKKKLYEKIANGEYQIVIGTHALLQEKVAFKKLGITVIDEQHRFGVKQRMELAQKGDATHILLMSATPIPRTLAMTLYGDLEVSSLQEKPAGRQKIDTRILSAAKLDEVIEELSRAIKNDERAYWVCPLIFDEEEQGNASAEKRYKELKKIFGAKVAIVHGQMKTKEKDEAIENFRTGKVKILVATTVIEVGVNVPEASIIIIEQAEKFGLAQLHQLRGRVGRGEKKSSCILVYNFKLGESGRRRLNILRESDDGFAIAEEDLMMRGSGDLIGVKQSGLPEFTFALLPEHKDLMLAARDQVKIMLSKDADLKSTQGNNLRNLLYLFEYEKQVQNLRS